MVDMAGMSAAALVDNAPAASSRLLVHVRELHGCAPGYREPAYDRLEAALGPDLAGRLVSALVQDRGGELPARYGR